MTAEHERRDYRIRHGITASLDEIVPRHVRHQSSNQTRPGADGREVIDIALPPRALASSEAGISSSRASLVRHLPSARSHTADFSTTIPCELQISPALNRDKRTFIQQPIRPPSSATRRRSIIMPALTGDTNERGNRRRMNPLSSWFQGSSAPVTFGIYVKKDAEPAAEASTVMSPIVVSHQQQLSTEANLSRPHAFRWLSIPSSIASLARTTPSPSATFGHFADSQTAVSEIFNSYLAKSSNEFSVEDLQASVRQAVATRDLAHQAEIASMKAKVAEYEAMREEQIEAEARVTLFKAQLDTMAAKVTEHVKITNDLAHQLASEREQRLNEEEARKRSIAIVKKQTMLSTEIPSTVSLAMASVPQDIHHPVHDSDPGYYSEAESSSSSSTSSPKQMTSASPTSSRCSSPEPRLATPTTPTTPTTPNNGRETGQLSRPIPPFRPRLLPRLSTFQKVLRDMTTDSSTAHHAISVNYGPSSTCPICSEGHASISGDDNALYTLRTENELLRDRVSELEKTVDNCLSLVSIY